MSAAKGQYISTTYTAPAEQDIRTFRITSDGRLMVDLSGSPSGSTSAALADNTANPTTTSTGVFISGFDGTTWDRVRVGITAAGTPTGYVNTLPGVQYLTSPLTLTNGQVMPAQSDVNGNLKVVEQYAPVYEDNTVGVAKVEHRYSYTHITTATTTVVKAAAGFLHKIIWNKGVANGVTTVYDNTSAAGTVVAIRTLGAALLNDPPISAEYNVVMTTGITIVTSAAEDVTVVWR
jgi:hypothetical protein